MLKKMVNGVEVECPAEEAAALEAEWQENAKQVQPQREITASDLYALLIAKGLLTESDLKVLTGI